VPPVRRRECKGCRGEGAAEVAREIGGLAVTADVGKEADVKKLVEIATGHYGPIDLFCSNAGVSVRGGAEAMDSDWQRCWDVHVMAHVYAARAILPSIDSIIRRLVKDGARVVYHARRWRVHVASAFPLGRYYGILFS